MLEPWNSSEGWPGHGKDGMGDSVKLKKDGLKKAEKKHGV